jgi:hypothetical protein
MYYVRLIGSLSKNSGETGKLQICPCNANPSVVLLVDQYALLYLLHVIKPAIMLAIMPRTEFLP